MCDLRSKEFCYEKIGRNADARLNAEAVRKKSLRPWAAWILFLPSSPTEGWTFDHEWKMEDKRRPTRPSLHKSPTEGWRTWWRGFDFVEQVLGVRSPGRYQELDLFIKVLRLLCPNLTDASPNCFPIEDWWSMIEDETVWLDFVHEASGFFFQPSVGLYSF